VGTYRIEFEVVDEGVPPARRVVEIEVSSESVQHAMAEAAEIAKRDHGDNAKPTRIVTYFGPASS
jgi:hypothetical protein